MAGNAARMPKEIANTRNAMVTEDDRIKKTKSAVWEISDKGDKWLDKQTKP